MSVCSFSREFIELKFDISCSSCLTHNNKNVCFIGKRIVDNTLHVFHFEIIDTNNLLCLVKDTNFKLPLTNEEPCLLLKKYKFLESFFYKINTFYSYVVTPLSSLYVTDITGLSFFPKGSHYELANHGHIFLCVYALYIFFVKECYFLRINSIDPKYWEIDYAFPNRAIFQRLPTRISMALAYSNMLSTNTYDLMLLEASRVKQNRDCELLSAVIKSHKKYKDDVSAHHKWVEMLGRSLKKETCPVYKWFYKYLKTRNILAIAGKPPFFCSDGSECQFLNPQQRHPLEHSILCKYSENTGIQIVNKGIENIYQSSALCKYLKQKRDEHSFCDLCTRQRGF